MNIRKIFRDHVASSAFQRIDGETVLVGNFGRISIIDELFDIWFVSNPPLTSNKITFMLKKVPEEIHFKRTTHEAYAQVSELSVVLNLLSLCGIKAKRKTSKEEKLKLLQRLKVEPSNSIRK